MTVKLQLVIDQSIDKMKKMSFFFVPLLFIALLSATTGALLQSADALNVRGPLVKSKSFLSPPMFLRPGDVSDKFYYDIDFPRGHLALKSFNGEVVDEHGVPVPLHETYLHHWVVEPYYAAKDAAAAAKEGRPAAIPARNAGVCGGETLGQYYGLGSETRRTSTWVPDPYGIEIGDPAAAPEGYEQRWLLNVHAIDTRGAADKLACTECRCDLYNVTVDQRGRRIEDGYAGGLRCCYDKTRCAVVEGGAGAGLVGGGGEAPPPRKVFLRYTVMWQEWSDAAVVPVKIYIFDVAACKVEYEVEECGAAGGGSGGGNGECVHVLAATQVLPRGGDVVFGVAHQHSGGIAASLHGDDGRLLCESTATYGDGEEAGNEAGYIVGMSTCYPEPGSVKVRDGEALTVVSRYSSERQHTGVMGLFYILVAEHQQLPLPAAGKPPAPGLCFSFPVSWCLPSWLSSNL